MTSSGNMVGLFAGIGGLELGLGENGWNTELLCEVDPGAQAVLRARFPDVPLHPDVTQLRSLPQGTELVAAGFRCQDLSQAGRTAGITGTKSSLVDEVFRLVRRKNGPRWLVIENVPFMLQLSRGAAMRHITDALEDLGYTWAYRVVDARAFGLPQRRQRVLMVASRTDDPRAVLFGQDAGMPVDGNPDLFPCGFHYLRVAVPGAGHADAGGEVQVVPAVGPVDPAPEGVVHDHGSGLFQGGAEGSHAAMMQVTYVYCQQSCNGDTVVA